MPKQSSARKMRKQYCQALPLLNKVIEYVETTLSDLPKHDFQLETDIKSYSRAVEKAKERQVKDLTQLSDLVRGRLYFSDNFEPDEVIDLLKELFKGKIKSIDKKRLLTELGLDYSAVVHCDMNVGGINFELQILPIEFKPHKEMLHHIYQELRHQNGISEDRRKHLRELHNKINHFVKKQIAKNRSSDD
jgi:hypothetical protein